MTLKISFNNHIHRISKTPASYKELTQLVASLFQNQLPERWTLQYVDSDGDSIMLADEHDFQNLLEGEFTSSNKAVKIYVIPVTEINQSHVRAAESVSESQVQKEEDEFQVIEKQEPVQIEEPKVEQQEVADEPKIEQPVEEIRQVEEAPAVHEEPKVEVEQEVVQEVPLMEQPVEEVRQVEEAPAVHEEPKVEAEQEAIQEVTEPEQKEEVRCHRKRFGRHGFHLKKILKKLSKTDLSAEKREYLEAKLREFEATLTAEDRERFAAKRETFAKRMTEKRAKADSEFKERVTDIIDQYLPTIASLTKEYVQEENKDKTQPETKPIIQAQPISKVVHYQVHCDGCGKFPVTGIRYKCFVCPDFDFCEDCEANKEHPHAFIKIKDSESFNSHHRGPRHHHFSGQGFFGRPSWNCRRHENKHEQPKAEETKKKVEEPKVPEFKNIFEALLKKRSTQPTENKEKEVEEAAKDLKKDVGAIYSALPQDFKSLINAFLGKSPEQLIDEKFENKNEEAKPEEMIEVPKVEEPKVEEPKVEEIKKEEVVIAEEPAVVNEVQAEVNENVPVIQVVENVPEVNKEDPKPIKKEYPEEVRNKVEFMREIFPDINEEELLEFVAKTPNLSIQELVENYLA